MEGLGNGKNSMDLLNLKPDRIEEKRNEAVRVLVRTFGLDFIVLLTRIGIIQIDYNVKTLANSGVADALRIFKGCGGDLLKVDRDGVTALHRASSVEVTKLLLDSGCRVTALDVDKNTSLHTASGRGLGDVIQVLLDAGASEVINDYNKFGKTAFHYSERFPEVREILVAAGANPELPVKR
jgi:ankyrin repeat protein